jgi:hypothetical protein
MARWRSPSAFASATTGSYRLKSQLPLDSSTARQSMSLRTQVAFIARSAA